METLTKAEEEKKKAAAVPHKKILKPPVSTKTLVAQRGGVSIGRDGKGNGFRDRKGEQRRPRSDENKEENSNL